MRVSVVSASSRSCTKPCIVGCKTVPPIRIALRSLGRPQVHRRVCCQTSRLPPGSLGDPNATEEEATQALEALFAADRRYRWGILGLCALLVLVTLFMVWLAFSV